MAMTHNELRTKFNIFWEERKHKLAPPIPLVPQNDPTTLFTGSGMQQFVPNLLGEPHPLGKRLYNIQRSFRSQDIEEIGDNRHTTMFEMMGNWSLGDYFKEDQIKWFFKFLTEELGLDQKKLYVTIFKGGAGVPKDEESRAIWKNLDFSDDHILEYPDTKNWWSRAGAINNMPVGEIGGPDSEVFYEFTDIEHNPAFGERCHPNCDCGRFLEIGNNVFIQYKKEADGTLSELPNKNVDFGGGLERLLAATYNDPDVFKTDLYTPIIKDIEKITGKKYEDPFYQGEFRIIADHLKASVFLIWDGIQPSNKEQGYVLRRLLRRATIRLKVMADTTSESDLATIGNSILKIYDGVYFDSNTNKKAILETISNEVLSYKETLSKADRLLDRYIQEIETKANTSFYVMPSPADFAKKAFDFYQSIGLPVEYFIEKFKVSSVGVAMAWDTDKLIQEKFNQLVTEFKKAHADKSRSSSAGKFKGGLADHSDQVLKYHTATHLLHQALFDLYGDDIRQEGSNITGERLRFDFYSTKKITGEDKGKITEIINKKVDEHLPMRFKIMPKDEAVKTGAKSFFREKYPDNVKVYYIGGKDDHPETAYSKEFCGGPHVTNTSEIGHVDVYKLEKIGSNLYRIYAK